MQFLRILSIVILVLLVGVPGAASAPGNGPEPGGASADWNDFDLAVRLYYTGRYEEAYSLLTRIYAVKLTSEQNERIRFLMGVVAYRLGRFDAVLSHLGGTGPIPAILADYALYYRAMAFWGLGRYDDARALLHEYVQLRPSGPLAEDARLTAAEALFHQGQPKAALQECQTLLKRERDGEVRLVMGRILESQGRLAEAREYYRQAMEESNTRQVRPEAAQKYKILLAPLLEESGQESAKLDMVRLLRREWRLEETLVWIDRFLAQGGSSDYVGTLKRERALTLFFSGRIQQAMEYFAEAAPPEQAKRDPYAAWMYARSLDRLGRWPEAADAFVVAAQASGPGRRQDDCLLDAGKAWLRAGDKVKAQECWSRISPSARNGRLLDEMLWSIGFFYFRNKAWDLAADRFLTLTQKCPRSDLRLGARYWLARSLDAGGREVKARQHYQVLAANEQDFYYRTLARERMGTGRVKDQWADQNAFHALMMPQYGGMGHSFLPGGELDASETAWRSWAASDPGLDLGDVWSERARVQQLSPPRKASPEIKQAMSRLKAVVAAGTLDLARQEAEYLLERIPNRVRNRRAPPSGAKSERSAEQNEWGEIRLRLFALASANLADVGDYRGFVQLQYRHYGLLLAGCPDEEKVKAQRRFYPLAFPGPVMKAAREFSLHPALVLSVIRTESYYHPQIISVANARGLMQLLPSTGRKLADRLNVAEPNPEALFDPETNIRLGSSYLAALLKEFDGQLPLALASYNAGPFNVKRWVSQAEPDVSLEEFIELIPFDQTRNYVKKILGAFYLYRYLFGQDAQGLDLAAPLRPIFLDEINF